MTTKLIEKKENLENYIRSAGVKQQGMILDNQQALLEKPILDSYEKNFNRTELVDLVNIIETHTNSGQYEVIDFKFDSLQEVSQKQATEQDDDAKKTNRVTYSVKLFSGKLEFSQEQLDDGQYNLTDFLGKKIIKLKRRTRNREIGKILQTATIQTATSIDDLKSIVSLINPERNVSMVVSQSLFSVLERLEDKSGNYLIRADKTRYTSDTFFVDNFLVVDDTTLGNKGDKKAFIGDLENFVTLFDRKKDTLSWFDSADYFGKRLFLHTRFDVKKVEEDCGYLIQWS
jgi:phage major capsid protein, HK97 family